jgi:lysophospholipase L1-like esterase
MKNVCLTVLIGMLLLAVGFPAQSYAREGIVSGPVKIMPLGDSNTDGYQTPGGYRIKLWNLLTKAGLQIDCVGSLSNGPESLPDRNHEGHTGWRIDEIHAEIEHWLTDYTPDIVLLMIGHNDMIQNYQADTAADRLSALLDTITDKLPETEILVASLTPMNHEQYNERLLDYNVEIPGVVDEKRNAGKRVHFVDMYDVITVEDLTDNVHPKIGGFDKMAEVWNQSILSVLQSAPPAALPDQMTFADVNGHWAQPEIEFLAAKGVVHGVTDGRFNPSGAVKRSEFAVMLVRAFGLEATAGTLPFGDVPEQAWYYTDIQAAYQAGWVHGVRADRFAPDARITREQMVVMIVKAYLHAMGGSIDEEFPSEGLTFNDADDISGWAIDYIRFASAWDLVQGMDRSFKPAMHADRAQAAVMISRLLKIIGVETTN